jgi:mannose-6-phosphate isomerase-like protein (cupin superfamily)
MIGRFLIAALFVSVVLTRSAPAQEVGSNGYIDLYFADWHASAPHMIHGSLEQRDIFTRGNPLKPAKKGAVLQFLNSYSYATLPPHASTTPARLSGKQEIYYFASGRGTAMAGGDNVELYRNVAILMPSNLEFSIRNTGDQPLTMYLVDEPVPAGFRPNPKMLVRDENTLPIASTDGLWSHIVKTLFVTADGLGTLESVLTVTLDSLTLGKPHSVNHNDIEEIWSSLEGTSLAMVGPFLRRQAPGMAYLHPPDNLAPHTNINYSEDGEVKFLYIARYHPHSPRP